MRVNFNGAYFYYVDFVSFRYDTNYKTFETNRKTFETNNKINY